MSPELQQQRERVHWLVDLLTPAQLGAVRPLLKVMLDDGPVSAEDIQALRSAEEYFRNSGAGIPFEQVIQELGFTMEQLASRVPPAGNP